MTGPAPATPQSSASCVDTGRAPRRCVTLARHRCMQSGFGQSTHEVRFGTAPGENSGAGVRTVRPCESRTEREETRDVCVSRAHANFGCEPRRKVSTPTSDLPEEEASQVGEPRGRHQEAAPRADSGPASLAEVGSGGALRTNYRARLGGSKSPKHSNLTISAQPADSGATLVQVGSWAGTSSRKVVGVRRASATAPSPPSKRTSFSGSATFTTWFL